MSLPAKTEKHKMDSAKKILNNNNLQLMILTDCSEKKDEWSDVIREKLLVILIFVFIFCELLLFLHLDDYVITIFELLKFKEKPDHINTVEISSSSEV